MIFSLENNFYNINYNECTNYLLCKNIFIKGKVGMGIEIQKYIFLCSIANVNGNLNWALQNFNLGNKPKFIWD